MLIMIRYPAILRGFSDQKKFSLESVTVLIPASSSLSLFTLLQPHPAPIALGGSSLVVQLLTALQTHECAAPRFLHHCHGTATALNAVPALKAL